MQLILSQRRHLRSLLLFIGLAVGNPFSLLAQKAYSDSLKKANSYNFVYKDSAQLKNIEDQYIIAELEKIQYAAYTKNLEQDALQKALENQRLKTKSLEQKLLTEQVKAEAERKQAQSARRQDAQRNKITQLEFRQLSQQVVLQNRTRNFWVALMGMSVVLVLVALWYNRRLLRKNREILEAMLIGQKTERRRVAADLHDNLGALISGIRLTIEAMDASGFNQKEKDIVQNVLGMTREAYNEVRLLSHNLQPAELEQFGLSVALHRLINKLNDSQQIKFSLAMNNLGQLTKELDFNLYSICLELANNIVKHSGATESIFEFITQDNRLQVLVSDNGKGFIVNNTSDGMGMRNVEERTQQMGGTFRLHSRPDEGTLFQFSIPLNPLTHASTQI